MRAINHALTGAVIGLSVDNPILAMPASLLSHLVCDVIPHHGIGYANESQKQSALKSKTFRYSLYLDALLCLVLVALLIFAQPKNWLVAVACAFLAASPDFIWVRRYVAAKKDKTVTPTRLENFLSDIQWFEKPIGAVVEIVWFGAFCLIIWTLIR